MHFELQSLEWSLLVPPQIAASPPTLAMAPGKVAGRRCISRSLSDFPDALSDLAVDLWGTMVLDLRHVHLSDLPDELAPVLADYVLDSISALSLSYPLVLVVLCSERTLAVHFRNARVTADAEAERSVCEVVWARSLTGNTALHEKLIELRMDCAAFSDRSSYPDNPPISAKLALFSALAFIVVAWIVAVKTLITEGVSLYNWISGADRKTLDIFSVLPTMIVLLAAALVLFKLSFGLHESEKTRQKKIARDWEKRRATLERLRLDFDPAFARQG